MLAIKDYIKTKQLTIIPVLKTFFRSKAYAIWDWRDIRPGVSYTRMMVLKIFKRLFGRA